MLTDIGITDEEYNEILPNLSEDEVLDDLECCNMHIISNDKLYRFTSDSVRLANLVKGKRTDQLIDLCSGGGIIPMLIAAKTTISNIIGVEIQSELFDLASRSAIINKLNSRITYINEDINNLNARFALHSFDAVTCNPPYYKCGSGASRLSPSAAIARHEISVNIEQIIMTAADLIKYGGMFYLVHKCDRLAEVISLLVKYKLEPKELYTYTPTANGFCDTFVVICKSNAKSGLIMRNIIIES